MRHTIKIPTTYGDLLFTGVNKCLIMLQKNSPEISLFAISRPEHHIVFFFFLRRDRKPCANNPSYRLPLSTPEELTEL